ncbi:MAG: hypothetical protein KAU50_05905, partial [Candidatus Marinimicrobia bacterium]|nr:hypothetical protein [Candidatus Neomarinimicrobiota bacterium]
MKRTNIIAVVMLAATSYALAGGIVHNTNQSAKFIRTLNRNASTSVDAAYFNPAGLTKLGDGIYIGVSNQSIFQGREVINSTASLNSDTFEGTTTALVFPNLYVAYKMGDLAFSGGLTPIGGGGSAVYDDGLPSFEVPVSALTLGGTDGLADYGVTDYKVDMEFEGSSIYLGFQGAVSYQVNDMISVAVGGRFISASNSYVGHLRDIEVQTAAGWAIPGDVMRGVAVGATAMATVYGDSATFFYTLATNYTGLDSLTYVAHGDAYATGAAQYTAGATLATATAGALDVQTADVDVDATETGTALAIIVGAHITPMEGLEIGVRYET